MTYTHPAPWTRQNAIFIKIYWHSRRSPNKTWSYSFHKALYFFSTDIFSHVYSLKYFLTYWKPAFGIWSIQNSASGKKNIQSQFGVLRNLGLKIKANGFDSTLLEFWCNLSSWELGAFRGRLFATIGNPAAGRALPVMPPGAGILPPATEQLCKSST